MPKVLPIVLHITKVHISFSLPFVPQSTMPQHLYHHTSPSHVTAMAHTYHCLCTTLILATNYDLDSLPHRAEPARDSAKIVPLNARGEDGVMHVELHNTVQDRDTVMVRRDDGFEKRVLMRCTRCRLVVGYWLDEAQFGDGGVKADEVLYVLPGALVLTEDMKVGRRPLVPVWAQQKA